MRKTDAILGIACVAYMFIGLIIGNTNVILYGGFVGIIARMGRTND